MGRAEFTVRNGLSFYGSNIRGEIPLTVPTGLPQAAPIGAGRQRTILAAAALGNMAGINTVLIYTIGIFISALHEDYGWSRADISLSMTWFTVVVVLGSALIGRVADRFDPGRLASVSMLSFGVALCLVPYYVHSIASLWISYLVMGLVGLGTSPAVIMKPVIAAFSRRRGLAIGIALSGGGLGGFLLPRLAAALTAMGSWRFGYAGLGCMLIVAAPILWVALGRTVPRSSAIVAADVLEYPGLQFGEAFRRRTFWMLTAIALLGGLGLAGSTAHLIPFLRDHGIGPTEAAALASLLGLASILGRLVTGFALDRVDGPLAGLLFFGIGALGLVLLVLFNIRLAAVAIPLLGFVIGSELDLLAYFTSRYFGLRAHAAVFGWTYGMIALGATISPALLGSLRDHRGDYILGLTLSGAALGVAALLCPLLGPYRYAINPR